MKKKQITKAGRTEAEYKQFLGNVAIYALGLDSIAAELRREAYAIAHAGSASGVTREIKSNFKLVEFDESHFDVNSTFDLRVKQKEGEELLSILVSFTAHFHAEKIRDLEKHATRFAESEARLIFWPYFRQMVADTTARMHIRPITIPLSLQS